jgi:hypothetical protein
MTEEVVFAAGIYGRKPSTVGNGQNVWNTFEYVLLTGALITPICRATGEQRMKATTNQRNRLERTEPMHCTHNQQL